jgi:DNA-binding response OmpR family regulator
MSDAGADAAVRAAFAHWFGIERGSCAVLCALYRAAEAPLSASALAAAAASTPGAVVNHHIHRLRQALEAEAIDFQPAAGYSLTAEGMAECRAAIRQIGEDLRRAG